MAVMKKDQLLYTGRGPLDSRSLVTRYDDLFKDTTWVKSVKADDGTTQNICVAHNGMIVAVWRNTTDTTKNGIYFLHDPNVVKTTVDPDYKNEENWHRLDKNDGSDISEVISRLTALEESFEEHAESAPQITKICGGTAFGE